jgi:hypothetical protein
MKLRMTVAAFALPCIAAAQQVVAAGARVDGQVTSVTGEPVAGATLRLQGSANLPSNTALTDVAGNFVFENIVPGSYTLEASRSGYTTKRYDEATISLGAGQVRSGLAIKLKPEALISGKVTGVADEPMDKVKVKLYRRTYGGRHWELQFVKEASTAVDGTFQVNAAGAGRYYLSAEELAPSPDSGQTPGGEVYVTTFYPSALDPAAALPVDLGLGEQPRLEIRMQKERVHHIRGKAINAVTGAPATDIALKIAPASSDASVGRIPPQAGVVRKEDGTFEFDRLLPGLYVISTATVGPPGIGPGPQTGTPLVLRQTVNLANLDVDDLTLTLTPPPGIAGTIRMDGADPQPALHVGIRLLADSAIGPVQSQPDGTFLIPAVAPDSYEVSFDGLPAGSYVKSMRFGGQDLLNRILDNTAVAGGSLEIILSPDAADLTGTVQNDNGDAAPGLVVTLWAPGVIRDAQSASMGSFRFQSVPPGNYYIVAWEQADRTLVSIPEFLAKFENQATSVTLGPQDHGTVQVKIVKRDAVEAEAARFR